MMNDLNTKVTKGDFIYEVVGQHSLHNDMNPNGIRYSIQPVSN
jgi:hypothetical protein